MAAESVPREAVDLVATLMERSMGETHRATNRVIEFAERERDEARRAYIDLLDAVTAATAAVTTRQLEIVLAFAETRAEGYERQLMREIS